MRSAGLRPRPVKVVAVLGGGLMGSGIATALVMAGVQVLLKEVNQQFLDVSGRGAVLPCQYMEEQAVGVTIGDGHV